MKQVSFTILDNAFQIGIVREDKRRFSVTVEDRTYEGQIEGESENESLVAVNGVLFSIRIAQQQKQGEFIALVNGRERVVSTGILRGKRPSGTPKKPALKTPPETAREKQRAPSRGISRGIKAPMPGKVVKVNVGVGDAIKPGDVVLILEAMKMENEICANVAGSVKEVNVEAGDSVDSNDVLVIIE